MRPATERQRQRCKNHSDRSAAKDGLCFRCWKASHPGQRWPYQRKTPPIALVDAIPVIPDARPPAPVTAPGNPCLPSPPLQERIFELIDTSLLSDVLHGIKTIAAKRPVTLPARAEADAAAILYDIIITEGVRS
jgi:hypothetical protein